MDVLTSKEQCNCPNGTYWIKHTAGCYERRIERMQQRVAELEAEHSSVTCLRCGSSTDVVAQPLTLTLPDDPSELLVTTARDAGFSDAQWKSMFYESGPYDITFPSYPMKQFAKLLIERLSPTKAVVTQDDLAANDLRAYGTSYMRIDADGTRTRIDPATVMISPQPADETTACRICGGTGWTETPDVYPDGSMATSRRCPKGCPESEDANRG